VCHWASRQLPQAVSGAIMPFSHAFLTFARMHHGNNEARKEKRVNTDSTAICTSHVHTAL
jgi:hypothetical protein